MKNFYLVLLFICIFYGGIPSPAEAQLVLQKSVVQHDIPKGGTVVDSFDVTNSTNKPLGIKLYWQDFIYKAPYDKGAKDFMPAGTSDYSCADMVTFSPTNLTLPPFGKENIKYSFKTPEDFQGGCDGVLFFEMDRDVSKAKMGMSFVTRIGALFFLESTDKDKTADVKDFSFDQARLQGSFHNQGNIVLFPKGIYYILNEDGLVEDRGEVNKLYIPPGARADFHFSVPEALDAGTYTVVLTFDLDGGDSIVKEADFTKSPAGAFRLIATRD